MPANHDNIFKKGVLLAETYEKLKTKPDIRGWHISEKLDGVRAYWNGRNFYSRNGLIFDAPAAFKKNLPSDVHLDGELFCGRSQFERCVNIVKYRKGCTAGDWTALSFVMFDAPIIRGNQEIPYEDRVAYLRQLSQATPFASAVPVVTCRGESHLQQLLNEVTAAGGEGLMLREPRSEYARARSTSLLKVKRFVDAEARVVGHGPGKNRLQGMLGTLMCEMPVTGAAFEVGTGFTDAQRNWLGAKKRWPVGTVISFKFQNLTGKGKPRFPVFLRERSDKSWNDVETDARKDMEQEQSASPAAVPAFMVPAPGSSNATPPTSWTRPDSPICTPQLVSGRRTRSKAKKQLSRGELMQRKVAESRKARSARSRIAKKNAKITSLRNR
jgi:DNA ligase-1